MYIPGAIPERIISATRAETKSGDVVAILLGERNKPNLQQLVSEFNRSGIEFFGGVFPGVLHSAQKHEQGAIVLLLPALEKSLLARDLDTKRGRWLYQPEAAAVYFYTARRLPKCLGGRLCQAGEQSSAPRLEEDYGPSRGNPGSQERNFRMNIKRKRPITILMAGDDPDDRVLTQEAWDENRLVSELHFVEDGEQLKAQQDILRTYDLRASSFITKPVTFESLADVNKTLTRYWFDIVEPPSERI